MKNLEKLFLQIRNINSIVLRSPLTPIFKGGCSLVSSLKKLGCSLVSPFPRGTEGGSTF